VGITYYSSGSLYLNICPSDFTTDVLVNTQAIKINWKDDAHNLTKLSPRVVNPEDPNDVEELGSFFNWFELGPDINDVSYALCSAG
jgi:template-activating factor I